MRPSGISRYEWLKYNYYFALEHVLGYPLYKKLVKQKTDKLYSQLAENVKDLDRGKVLPIKEVDKSVLMGSYKSYKHLLKQPLVIRGGANDWGCMNKWNFDFFSKEYGDEEIIINDLVGVVDPNDPQAFEKIKLRNFIEQIKNGSLKYLKFSNLVRQNVELHPDLNMDLMKKFDAPGSFGRMLYFFMGGAGSITPMHNEYPSVVHAQIQGTKKWTLYSQEERMFLDPRTERRTYFFSAADPLNVNDKNFPLLKYANKYEVICEPGDILYFPPYTWHYVHNITDSISISYKFGSLQSSFQSSKALTMLFLTATRPTILYNFIISRVKKDDYVPSKKFDK